MDTPEKPGTEAGAIHAALVEHMRPETLGVPIEGEASRELTGILGPRGHVFTNLEPVLAPLRAAPRRAKGVSAHQTFESFVAHACAFGVAERSAVFVDVHASTPKVTAIYDYGAPGAPAWREHRATLDLPFSEEWLAWRNAGAMPQAAFADFLESRLADVLDPAEVKRSAPSAQQVAELLGITYATQAQLLGLSRSLSVRAEVKVEQSQNLASGEGSLRFEETHETKSEGLLVKVPSGFCLALSVFRGDESKCVVPVRLRYRVKDGRVVWTLHPHRADEVLRAEVEALVKRLADATHLPTYAGTPEPAAQ